MSLYQLAQEGAVDDITTHLSESDSDEVRARAAEMLGDAATAEDDDAVTALIAAVKDDPDQDVRGAAVDALDALGQSTLERLIADLAGVDPENAADWAAANEYRQFLSADRAELRLAAATVLGRLGGDRVAESLLDLTDDPDSRVRARVARACGRIGARAATPTLADVLGNDDDARVRREAAEAIAAIGDDRALDTLVDAMDDPNPDVRRSAVMAIGEFGNPSAIEHVVHLIDDGDEAVRQATAFALIDLLSNAPAERSHAVREAIVDELGGIDQPAGVLEPLVDILESGSRARHRRNVAWLLGRIAEEDPPRDVIDALADTLHSSEETTARFAATSLVEIGGETVETTLVETLTDDTADESVRAKAAFALGKVGGDHARERLEEVIERTDSETIRERAFAALSKIGTDTDPLDASGSATPGQSSAGGE